jgi:hypothetical protein
MLLSVHYKYLVVNVIQGGGFFIWKNALSYYTFYESI